LFRPLLGSTLTIIDDGKPVGSKGKKFGFMIRYVSGKAGGAAQGVRNLRFAFFHNTALLSLARLFARALVSFMQMTRFVERAFQLEAEEERDEWVHAYEEVRWLPKVPCRRTGPPFSSTHAPRPCLGC
jgi:RAC serine/threonine-protein kinase